MRRRDNKNDEYKCEEEGATKTAKTIHIIPIAPKTTVVIDV